MAGAAIVFTSAELSAWIGSYLWPFIRVAAMVGAAPIYGTRTVPVRVRLAIALLLTIVIAPLLPPAPAVDALSLSGAAVTVQQTLIGLGLGFALRLAFTALEVAGESIGQIMGLGFASLIDPQNGVPVPMVSHFYTLIAVLLFFAFNAHWVLIEAMVESFRALPVGTQGFGPEQFRELAALGGAMFAAAVLVAAPVLTALLLVNLALGVMTRAAPQLNVFAVGFPVTLIIGFAVMLLALPLLPQQWSQLLDVIYAGMRSMMRLP